jgi:DOPA 4,5-dioxygenase
MTVGRPPAVRGFHAHVYYDAKTRATAAQVRAELARLEVRVGSLRDFPVGPHPVPHFEAAFATGDFAEVVTWLMLNRRGLGVLIHPLTGDDVKDHLDHALWLGDKLKLNI